MINLLPPREKERILSIKKQRIVIILWFLVLFFLICLILISFSIKVYIQSQVNAQKGFLEEVRKEAGQPEIKELEQKINSANSTLLELKSFYQNKVYFSGILEEISNVLPEKIQLTDLSTIEKTTETGKFIEVSLTGFSPTREILFDFKNKLEQKSSFKDIYFPPANWVKPVDINFSVSFKVDI